mgnify:CR=1 FL=1
MAVTIDPRPTYFGDRMIVTGSYAATDTSIDLSGLLVSIDAVILNSALAQVKHQDVDIANGTSWNIIANTGNGNVWDQQVLIELSSIAGGGQNPLNRCWIEWDSINNI